jgi:hypothetical protein
MSDPSRNKCACGRRLGCSVHPDHIVLLIPVVVSSVGTKGVASQLDDGGRDMRARYEKEARAPPARRKFVVTHAHPSADIDTELQREDNPKLSTHSLPTGFEETLSELRLLYRPIRIQALQQY